MPFSAISSDELGGVGGTCVLRGCVPKKLFVYGSHYGKAWGMPCTHTSSCRFSAVPAGLRKSAQSFEESQGFGWDFHESKPSHDWGRMKQSKNKELERLTGIYMNLLQSSGVDVKVGRGKVLGPHTVEVAGEQFTARRILIATGGRAFVPDIPGKEYAITSDEALELGELPKRVCVVGSGFIALEFAGIFAAFGSQVDLVYRQELPLRGFDEEVRTFSQTQLSEKGIRQHPASSPTAIEKLEDGSLLVTTSSGKIDCDEILFATGRLPNTKGLGLEEHGVELAENGAVKVDKYSCTSVPSIWAVGDVTDRVNLTPVALMEGMAFVATVFKDTPTAPDHEIIPTAVFSQPPVAACGLTEEEAAVMYGDIDVYTSSFRPLKHTVSGSSERSFMKLIVDASSDVVVGAHMVGEDAPEIMQGTEPTRISSVAPMYLMIWILKCLKTASEARAMLCRDRHRYEDGGDEAAVRFGCGHPPNCSRRIRNYADRDEANQVRDPTAVLAPAITVTLDHLNP
eukprot:scaffold1747_cov392-Prasinococcus_capsulatus_cf.AAC.4